jgi:hypothetical protein
MRLLRVRAAGGAPLSVGRRHRPGRTVLSARADSFRGMPIAHSHFEVDEQSASPVEGWPDGAVNRTVLHKTFTGDVAGTSMVAATMLGTPAGIAVYIALEHLAVSVHGLEGTFLLQHSGVHSPDAGSSGSWTIVPGSGTGGLTGISGTAELDASHDFTLDYRIG